MNQKSSLRMHAVVVMRAACSKVSPLDVQVTSAFAVVRESSVVKVMHPPFVVAVVHVAVSLQQHV